MKLSFATANGQQHGGCGMIALLNKEFSPEGSLIRPYDPGFFHIPLIGARNGNGDFFVLLKLHRGIRQNERAFVADIFDGALIRFTINGKRDLPVTDGPFDFSLVIHSGNYKPARLKSQ